MFQKEYHENIKVFKTFVLGLYDSGVSSIIFRYTNGSYNFYDLSNIFKNYKTKVEKIGNQAIKYELWDICLNDLNRTVNELSIRMADIIILVYNAANKLSFDLLKFYWNNYIQNNLKEKVSKK